MQHRPRISIFLIALCAGLAPQRVASSERFASFAGFKLWTNTLGEVQRALGPTPSSSASGPASSQSGLCYRSQGAFVTFYSGEKSAGTNLQVVAISKAAPHDTECSEPKDGDRLKSLEIEGLKLGMTRAEWRAAAPAGLSWNKKKGSASKPASAGYGAVAASKPAKPTSNVVTSIGAEFEMGRVVMFYVSRYEEQ